MFLLLINKIFIILCFSSVLNENQYLFDILDDFNQSKNNRNHTVNKFFTYNHQYKYSNKPRYDKNRPYNMSIDEMDTMMFCSILVEVTLRMKKVEIENITRKMNLSSSIQVFEKIGADIFEQCYKNADIKIVNIYIKNLIYFQELKWDKNLEKIVQINRNKYINKSDLILTQSQKILLNLYQRVDELFRQKKINNKDIIELKNNKTINSEIKDENNKYNFFFVIFFFVIFFGILIYLSIKLRKRVKDIKANKKEKIQ